MSTSEKAEGDEVFDETFDGNSDINAAFLVPRLATYASSSTPSTLSSPDHPDPLSDEDNTADDQLGAEERRRESVSPSADSTFFAHGDASRLEEVAVELEEEVVADQMDIDDDVNGYSDDSGEDDVVELPESSDGLFVDRDADGDATERPLSFISAFHHSRVRELLKFDGSSGIVSKEATFAATEAVALMLRDLTKMAVEEAARRHRKTISYDDISRVVQLIDRFSFLSDALPPPAAASSATEGVVLGSSSSTRDGTVGHGAGRRHPPRAKSGARPTSSRVAPPTRGPATHRPTPTLRQSTLRF